MISKRTASATAAAAVLLALLGVARARVAQNETQAEGVAPAAGTDGRAGSATAAATGANGAASANPSAHPTGVLCLRKLPAPIEFRSEGKGGSGFDYQDTAEAGARRMAGRPRLEVSVDRSATVIVDQKQGGCIDGLALDVKHAVRVSRPGVSRQAAHFSFANGQGGGNVLELRYDPFYGNVHIDPPATTAATAVGAASCAVCANAFPVKKKQRDVGSLIGRQEPPRAPISRRERADRWPKPATVTGPEPLMLELPKMKGVTILDHGARPVPPDRWEIEVVIDNARAAAALRKRGVQIELGEEPTEQELREDVFGPDAARKPNKPRR